MIVYTEYSISEYNIAMEHLLSIVPQFPSHVSFKPGVSSTRFQAYVRWGLRDKGKRSCNLWPITIYSKQFCSNAHISRWSDDHCVLLTLTGPKRNVYVSLQKFNVAAQIVGLRYDVWHIESIYYRSLINM